MRHGALAGLLLAAATAPCWAATITGAPGASAVERGRYLATAGDCVACHTAPGGAPFAGGLMMRTPFGQLSTPNITPDRETGIGAWSDDDFVKVFHSGIGRNGERLYPAMPFPWYTRVTRADVLDIKAYLFSLRPVHAPRRENAMQFPFNIRAGLVGWDALFLERGEFRPDPNQSDQVNRGAYLAQGLGHCGECHNGNNLLGASFLADHSQGGPIDQWYAPNITSDATHGIGRFSTEKIADWLGGGTDPDMGVAVGPMAQTIQESLSKLTREDRLAIAAYLKSTPPAANTQSVRLDTARGRLAAGGRAYDTWCASCHRPDGQGIAGAVPALAHNGAVIAGGPQTVLRVVLQGAEARGTYAPMPAFGQLMTDQQIADIANYVRQSWGNAAPAVAGPGLVGDIRADTHSLLSLTAPPDGCHARLPAPLDAAVRDPALQRRLAATDPADMLPTAEAALRALRHAAPALTPADRLNGLTVAYCIALRADPALSAQERVRRLGQLVLLAYARSGEPGG